MKEATGELSTTVIAIVAIAAILAIFTAFLLPTLRAQIALTQACNNGPGYSTADQGGGYVVCGTVGAAAGTGEATCAAGGATGQQRGSKVCNSDNTAQSYTCVYCESTTP